RHHRRALPRAFRRAGRALGPSRSLCVERQQPPRPAEGRRSDGAAGGRRTDRGPFRPMTGLDTTVMPWRPDLAAASLADRWRAARHVEGKPYHAVAATVPLRGTPDATASATTELLFGEAFTVYEIREGWAWGQMAVDDYVGWAPLAGLAPGL